MDLTQFGKLHLVVLHLPIGLVAAIVLVECLSFRLQSPEAYRLQGGLVAANALAALLAAALGLLLAAGGEYSEESIFRHRWAGVVCAALAVAAWFAYVKAGRWIFRLLLAALLTSTVAAGHLGAALTHGEDFVVFWEPKRTKTKPQLSIEPILERHCYECHGNGKAKGKLALDSAEGLLKGGKSGKQAIVPGDPKSSELVRRITLPRNTKQAMPPSDRPGLNAKETVEIERWIAEGAKVD